MITREDALDSEGFKSSAEQNAAAGEISSRVAPCIKADTMTTVVVDPRLEHAVPTWRNDPTEDINLRAMPTETDADLEERTAPNAIFLAKTDPLGDSAEQPAENGIMTVQTQPASEDSEDEEALTPQPTTGAERATNEVVMAAPTTVQASAVPPQNTESQRRERQISSEFEAFAAVQQSPTQPDAAMPPPPVAAPLSPFTMPGSHQHVVIEPIPTPGISAFGPPQPSRLPAIVGMLISMVVFASIVFALYVLHRNDWSFDLSRLDEMLDRAFGHEKHQVDPALANLEVSTPVVGWAMLGGKSVLTAEGVVKNNGTLTRRFVYVRALVKRRGRLIASAAAPAGNVFRPKELAALDRHKLEASLNPAGKDGRNAKLTPGDSVAYMVVIPDLPQGFDLEAHEVSAEVSDAEIYEGP